MQEMANLRKIGFADYTDGHELKMVSIGKLVITEPLFERISEERKIKYKDAYQQGKKLPPLAVRTLGECEYEILDGNHRYCSAKAAGLKRIWVIVMKDFKFLCELEY